MESLVLKITITADGPEIYDNFTDQDIENALRTILGPYPMVAIETLEKM